MYGKMQESGLTEIIPFISISAIWGQGPAFFAPQFLSAYTSEWLSDPKGILLPECPEGSGIHFGRVGIPDKL